MPCLAKSAAALLHVLERSIDRARRDPGRKFKPVVLGEIQAAGVSRFEIAIGPGIHNSELQA
jgi:hypothetical protein